MQLDVDSSLHAAKYVHVRVVLGSYVVNTGRDTWVFM